jgi:hypothetical protein
VLLKLYVPSVLSIRERGPYTDVTQKNLLPLSGKEPRFLNRPAHSLVTIPIKLSRLYILILVLI